MKLLLQAMVFFVLIIFVGCPNESTDSSISYTLTVGALANGNIKVMNGTNVLVAPYTVPAGTTLTLTAEPSSGYTFNAWTGSDTSTTNPLTITMTSNKTIGASFVKDGGGTYIYTLSIDATSNGNIEVKKGTEVIAPPYIVPSGTVLTLTAKPDSGYTFSTWTGSDNSTTNPLSLTMNGSKTIGASFGQHLYTLTVDAPSFGSIEVKNGEKVLSTPYSVPEGTMLTLTAKPDKDFKFNAWTGSDNSTTNPLSLTMNGNKTIGVHIVSISTDTAHISFKNENPTQVSDKLIGFNTIYSHYSDAFWKDTEVKDALKDMGTHFLRWPGGAPTNRFHWNNLNGQGWQDNWNPDYDADDSQKGDRDESLYTDLDEYIAICKEVGATPLVGINQGSGLKYNRVQDGIEEAKALVQYCKTKGYNVNYYYLDNEPYHDGANRKMTAAEYAEQINLYAPAIKEVNPNAKIVINWEKIRNNSLWNILRDSGNNIDIVEIHFYWDNTQATFETWKNQIPMSVKSKWYNHETSYVEEIAYFYEKCKNLGYNNIKLASFEWNVGGSASALAAPTKYESTIMQTEMLMQFMNGGLEAATMWPIFWPKNDPNDTDYNANRYLMDPEQNYELSPSVEMFEMLSEAEGQNKYTSTSTMDGVYSLVAESSDKNTLLSYTHSKLEKEILVSFKAPEYAKVELEILKPTSATDRATGKKETMGAGYVTYNNGYYSYYLPAYSLGFLKLSK